MTKITFPARLGLFLWIVAIVFIGWKVGFEPGKHTVIHHYLSGAQRWLDQVALYTGPHGFIYMPAFAALFSPLAKLPVIVTDILWRVFILSLYFYALSQLVKSIIPKQESFWQWFGLASLIALPIAFSGLRNGQMNVILSAVMVMVTAWLIQQRWTAAAVVLAFVLSLKPTFAVFFLLAVALYRPLWWRVPPLLLAFLALPLLIGGEDYGIQQYINFYHMSQDAMEMGMEEPNWATFFNIAPQLFDFYVPELIQLSIKLPLAVLTLWYCYNKMQKTDAVTAGMIMLSLACCYHMLFNPRSVNTDYIILGSIMAFWFAASACLWKDKQLTWLVGLNALLVLEAYELSKLVTPDHHSWMNPVAALLFAALVLWQLRSGKVFVSPQ